MSNQQNISFGSGGGSVARVIVVGAGIAGLSVAYYLNKAGYDVRLYERDGRAGGAIRTALTDERYLVEHGPNTYLSSSESIAGLTRELSIDGQTLVNNAKERFVFWEGALRNVPRGPLSFLGTKLLSPVGKIRMMAEPFVRSRSCEGESLAGFVRRRAGSEPLNSLVNPFVSGVWAGDPEQLEMQSVLPKVCEFEEKYGSVLKGLAKERRGIASHGLVSYRWGMGTLPARLEDALGSRIKLNASIGGIRLGEDGRLFVVAGSPQRKLEADAVVVATNARAAAPLVEALAPAAAMALRGISSCSLAVVHTAYRRDEVKARVSGFGMLIPRDANIRLLGTIFSSALFEGRAPEGEVLLTNFIGGATDPDIMNADDHEILKEVRRGLHATMGITAKPLFVKIIRHDQAIPQYTQGHAKRMEAIANDLKSVPGVYLTGNYFSGISVADTIGNARATAEAVRGWLSRPKIRTLNTWQSLI